MSPEFNRIFLRLRELLIKQAGSLTVSEDTPTKFCLSGGLHPKHKTPMPTAWAEIGKAYVSYHLMPVYGHPKLLAGFSDQLKARMQGKSCFNFKTADEKLFAELERLTKEAIAAFRKAGYLCETN